METTRITYRRCGRRAADPAEPLLTLMQVMARACGHASLPCLAIGFRTSDLPPWKRGMADLTGLDYGGVAGRS